MMEYSEKTVLMKCEKCKYQEQVPLWILDELESYDAKGEERVMYCPKCDALMKEVKLNIYA